MQDHEIVDKSVDKWAVSVNNQARRYNNQANDARLERGNRLKEARERVGALELELHTLDGRPSFGQAAR
jgi:hypothetical protein